MFVVKTHLHFSEIMITIEIFYVCSDNVYYMFQNWKYGKTVVIPENSRNTRHSFRVCIVSISAGTLVSWLRFFYEFPQSLKGDPGIISQLGHEIFPPPFFFIYHSLFILRATLCSLR
jgi:hypothetical protein